MEDKGTPKIAAQPYSRSRLYDKYITSGMENAGRLGLDAHYRTNLLPHLPQPHSALIADMGCGSGALVAFLIRQGYQSVIGVDGSAEQVAVAHAAGIDSVRQGDVFDFLHGARESFDAITAVDILEHFRKDEVLDFLVAVRLALRPGGRIIVQTTNGGSPFFGNYRYADFTHELAFTAQSINQVMMVTGYARTTVYPVRPGVHGIRSLVRRGLWGGVETVMVACLVIETGIRKGHVVSQNLIAVGERDAASELGIQTT